MAEDMSIDIQEIKKNKVVKIVVIGVGGGGSNMVSHLYKSSAHEDLTLIAANTDIQHLSVCQVPIKIQLGERITAGLGAGADDEMGKKAALESMDEIKHHLTGADMVIVCAGLGGGTGTGAAPVIAQIAKELGALTVSISTKPFKFEGPKRMKAAQRGFEELNKVSDSIIVVPNDKLRSIIGKNTGLKESFRMVDSVLSRAASGLSSIILDYGEDDINVDFADLKRVMNYRGLALMGIGEGSGENASIDALRSAIESPLFDNLSINGAKGVAINFYIHPEYPMMQIEDTMDFINEVVDSEEADIIFGTRTDASLPQDFARVTVIATGFEKSITAAANPEQTSAKQADSAPKQQDFSFNYNELKLVSGSDDVVDYDQPSYLRAKKD
ncbi:cell division protein FtsZ [Helicobacter sp. CLO-3]|uniref:cell division protein FtsZ n=1 Tax=unclassified Helicobacter TaxID=2593540 RepID=UPI0008055396|nr:MULTISPECIES: cell division protein FtsZ [unclassified Helicobacter]OBV29920.1 cell division protein FtsZ [Helicobacter sp. CLO-3]OHU81322.1 cell division protein FtsZ [Helicobacter sp. CLO-3]